MAQGEQVATNAAAVGAATRLVPGAQSVQSASEVAAAATVAAWNLPAPHDAQAAPPNPNLPVTQFAQAVLALEPAGAAVPASQLRQSSAVMLPAPTLYLPSTQSTQAAAAAPDHVPAPQLKHAAALPLPVAGLAFPAVQDAHVAEPAVAYVPALQLMQTASDDAAAPVVAEAVPALHGVHVAAAAAA